MERVEANEEKPGGREEEEDHDPMAAVHKFQSQLVRLGSGRMTDRPTKATSGPNKTTEQAMLPLKKKKGGNSGSESVGASAMSLKAEMSSVPQQLQRKNSVAFDIAKKGSEPSRLVGVEIGGGGGGGGGGDTQLRIDREELSESSASSIDDPTIATPTTDIEAGGREATICAPGRIVSEDDDGYSDDSDASDDVVSGAEVTI